MSQAEQLPAVNQIKMNEAGQFMPTCLEDQFRLARMYVASGMLPKRFTTPESVVTAMQYLSELGLRGITALRQVAVIHGSPALFGDLPLAVVRGKGKLESIEEFLVTGDGTEVSLANKNITSEICAAVCTVKRKGEKPHQVVYTVGDAKLAGLWGQNCWKTYPKDMLMYKARGRALKNMFPDDLNGIGQGESDYDTMLERVVENEVVSSGSIGAPSGAAKLNSLVTPPAVAAKPQDAQEAQKPAQEAAVVSTPVKTEVLPVATPAPKPGSFDAFQGTTVKSAPKLLPSRDDLALEIGALAKDLNIGLDELTKKSMAEFSKEPDQLTADEMQVMVMVLRREKGKKPLKGSTA